MEPDPDKYAADRLRIGERYAEEPLRTLQSQADMLAHALTSDQLFLLRKALDYYEGKPELPLWEYAAIVRTRSILREVLEKVIG